MIARWASVLVALAAAGAGLVWYVATPTYRLRDPVQALQQLDLLYLDEPAPAAEALQLAEGEQAVVVVCEACALPEDVDARIVRTADPVVARSYGLQRVDGSIGPGYALVDRRGHVRYRTFDPGLERHGPEIRTLLAGMP